jgi:hypothetical protein
MPTQADLFSVPAEITGLEFSGASSPSRAGLPKLTKEQHRINDAINHANRQRDNLRAHLSSYGKNNTAGGWRTREQICEALGWSERHLRQVAESFGPDIIRSQAGFKLTDQATRDDVPLALQSCDSFLSQGKRMIRYSMALRKKLHALIG